LKGAKEMAREKTEKECINHVVKKKGYVKISEKIYCHGEAIFYNKKDKTYISYDHDEHRKDRTGIKPPGRWKMAYSIKDLLRGDRIGTFDWDLNWVTI
jgi:hypothetical protein